MYPCSRQKRWIKMITKSTIIHMFGYNFPCKDPGKKHNTDLTQ